MRPLFLLVMSLVFLHSCKPDHQTAKTTDSLFQSESATAFHIRFANDPETQGLIRDRVIYGSGATVSLKTIDGIDALEVRTDQEFSDAFIDLEQLFGHTIDLSKARYVSLKLRVPNESFIRALKFNVKDEQGNFGGFNEITNNFYGNYDRWMDVLVDMQQVIPVFKNWHGAKSPLQHAKLLSLNPYNAHQADSSSIYVHSIRLSNEPPQGDFTDALAPRPLIEPNSPLTITFDDGELTHRQMAIRAFESTYQAMARNVAGNETMAIRLKGKESDKHLAFLPILDKMTGQPVDFTQVKRLHFSYYLTEDSADFDGAILYLANEHWEDVLVHKQVFSDFRKKGWHDVRIDFAGLGFHKMEGHEKVLPNVYEIRLGLNYRPGRKNIEMWLDNFGWE